MTETTWKTVPSTGHAHLVQNKRPVCGAPVSMSVTWIKAKRSHGRCADCLAIEQGATVESRNIERAHGEALRENEYRAFND